MTQTAVQRHPRSENGAGPLTRRATRRAAVYTRVSTDEQAALEFNSLEAQKQICETYISMRSADPASKERWVASETYSDPGYSGGTLERPALRRLLTDVEAGRIDVIVCYKIDRLSRSIHQFYRIWDVLERYRVDLVCATQDLNTSTSQGKLMLNMLLSFGQFEREQIGERTRDKIQAARRRGRWTGGFVPLGYDARDGRLIVNEEEAGRVREIFGLYLETLSLTRTVEELSRFGLTMKTGTHQNGTARSARPFDKPSLLRLLRNPVYAGLTRCNGTLADGEHDAIVPQETWQRVQERLTRNGSAGYRGERQNQDALLRGLLFCGACGSRMSPTYTVKGNRRYRYYVCQSVMKRGAHACPTGRVAAAEVERQVVERIREIGKDPELVAETVRQARAQLDEKRKLLEAERRQLTKDLGRQKAAMKRLVRGAAGNGDVARRLAEIQGKAQAIEKRLEAIGEEIGTARGLVIDERDVASVIEAFGPVWEALWPAERARMLGLLVERIDYGGWGEGLAIRFLRAAPHREPQARGIPVAEVQDPSWR